MNTKQMMHTRGLVIDINDNGFARVMMDRKSACSGCDTGKIDKCKTCLSGSTKIVADVINKEKAQKGDIVTVSLSTNKILKGAAAFYLIPVVGLILGAFSGQMAAAYFSSGGSAFSFVGGFIGIVIGFYSVKLISDRLNANLGMVPRVRNIIHSESIHLSGRNHLKVKSSICTDCK